MERLERARAEVLERLFELTEARFRELADGLEGLPEEERLKAMYAAGAMDALELVAALVQGREPLLHY